MEIKVMNHMSIVSYQESRPHIIISIGDPQDSVPVPICEQPACKGILRLRFNDSDDKVKDILDSLNSLEAKRLVLFSRTQAKQIFDFIQFHILSVDTIIAQCDAGISRSAGVAAALSRVLNKTDEYFFRHHISNSRVYRILLNSWFEELEK